MKILSAPERPEPSRESVYDTRLRERKLRKLTIRVPLVSRRDDGQPLRVRATPLFTEVR